MQETDKQQNDGGKLNICMLGHKRIPSREGGVVIAVKELSTWVATLGYYVICCNRWGHHVSRKEFDGEKLFEYKGVKLKSVFTSIRAAFGKCGVVHFHAEVSCAVLWILKMFGKRCVATIPGV